MMDFSTHPRAAAGFGERAFVALALGCLIWSAWGALRARAEVQHARAMVAQAESENDAAQARLRVLESKRTGDAERLASRLEWTAAAPPPRVLADLTALLSADVRLASLTLAYADGVAIEAQVAARNARAYDGFIDRLTASPQFSAVEPGEETRDGEVQARVKMSWRGTP
jgi:hypothetical protein